VNTTAAQHSKPSNDNGGTREPDFVVDPSAFPDDALDRLILLLAAYLVEVEYERQEATCAPSCTSDSAPNAKTPGL
jgi:hypothetical protein